MGRLPLCGVSQRLRNSWPPGQCAYLLAIQCTRSKLWGWLPELHQATLAHGGNLHARTGVIPDCWWIASAGLLALQLVSHSIFTPEERTCRRSTTARQYIQCFDVAMAQYATHLHQLQQSMRRVPLASQGDE